MNGTTTTTSGGWLDVIDRNLQGWLNYFNNRNPTTVTAPIGGVSSSSTELAVLQAQLDAQRSQQNMLLLAGGALLLYLVLK